MRKIDIHIHCSKDGGHEINGQELINKDQMIKSMDERGVVKSVLMSSSAKASDLLSNDELRQICKESDRFYYMSMVDFDKDIYDQLKREKDLGSLGVGELVYNKAFNSPEIFKLLEAAQELEMPVLFHISPQLGKYYGVYDLKGLPYLEEALERFENLIFIGHSQAFWCEISKYDENDPAYRDSYPKGPVVEGRIGELMRKYPNLYADLSANSGSNALMRDKDYGISFIKEFSDRLFFGTDTFSKDQKFPLDSYLEKLGQEGLLEKEELEKIYYKNFERVFSIKEK